MAIQMYFKMAELDTPAVRAGREFHEKWDKEIKETKCLPKLFGAKKLNNFESEKFASRELDKWLILNGKVDLYDIDEKTIYDWKTGVVGSESYANSKQSGIYQILIPEAKKFVFYCYNQYNKKVEMSIRHLTKKTLKESLEWVSSLAGEMYNYLETNEMYQRFSEPCKVHNVYMYRAISKSGTPYFYHLKDGKICFGDGFKEKGK